MGMQPHERAEAYEDGGMFREALKWHREDLAAARARALDGEEEDERESSLDLARALRNTGRCLGRLGNSGFAEVGARVALVVLYREGDLAGRWVSGRKQRGCACIFSLFLAVLLGQVCRLQQYHHGLFGSFFFTCCFR